MTPLHVAPAAPDDMRQFLLRIASELANAAALSRNLQEEVGNALNARGGGISVQDALLSLQGLDLLTQTLDALSQTLTCLGDDPHVSGTLDLSKVTQSISLSGLAGRLRGAQQDAPLTSELELF